MKNYIDNTTLKLLYDVLNIKLTHGIEFQFFFDLMQTVSENLGLNSAKSENFDDEEDEINSNPKEYLHVNVLNIFCKNFIKGFSKLIIDLGFDNFLLDEIKD